MLLTFVFSESFYCAVVVFKTTKHNLSLLNLGHVSITEAKGSSLKGTELQERELSWNGWDCFRTPRSGLVKVSVFQADHNMTREHGLSDHACLALIDKCVKPLFEEGDKKGGSGLRDVLLLHLLLRFPTAGVQGPNPSPNLGETLLAGWPFIRN